jgi:signal transduction histidine kinase
MTNPTQPNLAIYPPPPRRRAGGVPHVPRPLLVGLLVTLPAAAIGDWMAEAFWVDPVPPDDSPPMLAVLGWTMFLAACLAFVVLAVAAVVTYGLAYRARPALDAKTAEVEELRASRGRLVDASDRARRAIERDLHDGVQPRLVALLLTVGMARRAGRMGDGTVIDDIESELREILKDIRSVASGVLPPALTDLGLEAAVTELTGRLPFRVRLSLPRERLPDRAEVTAYFVIAEALTNAAKYADPTRVTVRVEVRGKRVTVEVADDGRGGAVATAGTGLLGLADRVDTLDGRLTLSSPSGQGTTVTAEFSCAS